MTLSDDEFDTLAQTSIMCDDIEALILTCKNAVVDIKISVEIDPSLPISNPVIRYLSLSAQNKQLRAFIRNLKNDTNKKLEEG